jgi:hypothetical protein
MGKIIEHKRLDNLILPKLFISRVIISRVYSFVPSLAHHRISILISLTMYVVPFLALPRTPSHVRTQNKCARIHERINTRRNKHTWSPPLRSLAVTWFTLSPCFPLAQHDLLVIQNLRTLVAHRLLIRTLERAATGRTALKLFYVKSTLHDCAIHRAEDPLRIHPPPPRFLQLSSSF